MKTRRIAAMGLGIFAAASLSLTACESTGTTSTGTSPSASAPAPTAAPADTLIAALGKLKSQGYDVKMTAASGGLNGNASIDPTAGNASLEEKGSVQGVTIDISAVEIGTDLWAKIDLGAASSQLGIDPTKWMLVDQTKLTGADSKPFDLTGPDALAVAGLLTSVTNVTATDATHLSGTVDLTAATGISSPDSSDLSKAGDAAKTVPFTVTLDDQGRITDIKVTPSAAELAEEFTFSNYGSPTAITAPPAANVIPAPAAIYSFFNES